MSEIDKEIASLKELVQDRTDAIDKTLDATSQVARSLETLVARQSSKNRLHQLNSFVAYCLFTLLLGTGFFLLYKSRASELEGARGQALKSALESRDRARELQDSQVERKRSARIAADYYELIREGRHADIISGYSALEKLTLSKTERAVFDDGLKQARVDMVDAGYLAGVDAFRRGDYEAATAELRRGLTYAEEGDRAAQMRYYLGISLSHQGSQDEAVQQLELAISGNVEQAGINDARFHLGNTLVQDGRLDEARVAFGTFANKHPNHRFAQMSRRKAAQILRAARERERMARNAPTPQAPSAEQLKEDAELKKAGALLKGAGLKPNAAASSGARTARPLIRAGKPVSP